MQSIWLTSLSLMRETNLRGAVTFTIGPNESSLITISVSSSQSYVTVTEYLSGSCLSALFSKWAKCSSTLSSAFLRQ